MAVRWGSGTESAAWMAGWRELRRPRDEARDRSMELTRRKEGRSAASWALR